MCLEFGVFIVFIVLKSSLKINTSRNKIAMYWGQQLPCGQGEETTSLLEVDSSGYCYS